MIQQCRAPLNISIQFGGLLMLFLKQFLFEHRLSDVSVGAERTEQEIKINRRIFGMDGRLVEQNMQPTDARLMPVKSGESSQN